MVKCRNISGPLWACAWKRHRVWTTRKFLLQLIYPSHMELFLLLPQYRTWAMFGIFLVSQRNEAPHPGICLWCLRSHAGQISSLLVCLGAAWDHLLNPASNNRQMLLKRANSRFEHLEKCILNLSSSSFAICVNLLHSLPSLFHNGLLLSL